MPRRLVLLVAPVLLAVLAVALPATRVSGSAQGDDPSGLQLYLPQLFGPPPPMPSPTEAATPTNTPTPSPTPAATATDEPAQVEWDQRLDRRGVSIIPAQVQPGQGYWRLIKGMWYAENEPPFAGQHHIFVDTLNTEGQRHAGVPISVTNLDGGVLYQTLVTESKPGDHYAANFPMYTVAPAYRAIPSDGSPADAVSGLGLGSIEQPLYTIHSSYGFVWQWAVAPGAPASQWLPLLTQLKME